MAMKINFIKQYGGVLVPADDLEAEQMGRFKTGEMYESEIKLTRNPAFHRKVFQFFSFCFDHWAGDREFLNEKAQKDVFRKNLTVMAGYYVELVNIKGEVRIEAKSLSFGSMTQDEFEQCYSALINAAMKHIFPGADESTYNQLVSFF